MRRFVDLCLQPNLDHEVQLEKLVCQAATLGFKVIGVSLPSNVGGDKLRFLRKICEGYGVDLASRLDLAPRSSGELLRKLRQLRRRFELVAVKCFSKAVARQAAKDRRVDLLVFPSRDRRERFFDVAEARLASEGAAALEMNASLVLGCQGLFRVRLLSCLRQEANIAERFGVPLVVCSGGVDVLGLRGPYELASLAMLFGMKTEQALNAVSTVPYCIVERNRGKLREDFVVEGVRVVRRGKNCEV